MSLRKQYASSMVNTMSEHYSWWGDLDEALETIDWSENVLKAFAGKMDFIDIDLRS